MSSDSIDSLVRQFEWNDNGALAWADQDQVMWDARLLTSTGVRHLSYSSTTGRLAQSEDSVSTTEYTYDAQGNRTKSITGSDEISYTWNGLNQLTKLDSTSFSYGADGIRTKVGSAAQAYDQGLKLLSDGEMKYLWSPDGSLLAQAPLNSSHNTESQRAVTDALGSVYTVLNEDLASVGEYSYTLFGERTLTAGTDVSVMGFTSEQHDASGLIYLRYRYLDPSVGQFISLDPLISSTLDPYGYASGNPLQMTDPLGLFSWGDVGSFLYDNAGTISTVLSVAAIAASATGVGAPIGAALGVASAGFAFTSATKNYNEGNYVDMGIDIVAGGLGLAAFGATLRASSTTVKTIAAGAQSRAEIRVASRTSRSIATTSENAGYGILAVTTAGKGQLC